MKVAGANEYRQLCADSNNRSASYYPVISPPVKSELDISQTLSYSVYRDHAVWITREMKAHAVGDNSNGRICGSLPMGRLDSETAFDIKDENGSPCEILSAVCGSWYTLYKVQSPGTTDSKLAYVVYNKNDGNPLFINTDGRRPIGIFGGESKAASVDTTGSVIVITESLFDSPESVPQILNLPGEEKATSVACCNQFIAALSNSGKVYLSAFIKENNSFSPLIEVPTLSGIKFVFISGSFEHCLAVSDDGKVYGIGSNYNGVLGFEQKVTKADKFREIPNLQSYKIKAAYAGFDESLFLTDDGKVLSCGNNSCGQLMMNSQPSAENIYSIRETAITEGATFCIAGYGLSAVIVDANPPPYSPNFSISEDQFIKERNILVEKTQSMAQALSQTTMKKNEIENMPVIDANSNEHVNQGTQAVTQENIESKATENVNQGTQAVTQENIESKATENVGTAAAEEKSKCCLLI